MRNTRSGPYPEFVCLECGLKYGKCTPAEATWYHGQCEVCGEVTQVTDPIKFCHLKDGWRNEARNVG